MTKARSLYSNLFAYRNRERNWLENFTTEALVDLLKRMPEKHVTRFITELLVGEENRDSWHKLLQMGAPSYWWERERWVDAFSIQPDIVLHDQQMPLFVIECKIDHPVNASQLRDYGRWLDSVKDCRATFSSLVLVTKRGNEPPTDFLNGSGDYCAGHTHVCYWDQIWNWLKKYAKNTGDSAAWEQLSLDLTLFLEEQGMDNQPLSYEDLISTNMAVKYHKDWYSRYVARTDAAFDPITNRIAAKFSKYQPKVDKDRDVWGRGHSLFDAIQFKSSHSQIQWKILWGIVFAGSDMFDDLRIELPSEPYIFIDFSGVDPNNDELSGIVKFSPLLVPSGWNLISDQSDLLATSPIANFSQLSQTELFKYVEGEWMEVRTSQIASAISALALHHDGNDWRAEPL